MPEIPLGLTSHKRRSTWNPTVRALNMLVEKSETNQINGIDHIQRPGLALFSEVGTGPIRGVFRRAGSIGGDFLVASGVQWFRVTLGATVTLLGSLPGTDRTSTASTSSKAITVSGGNAYSTTGGAPTQIVMPDSRPVSSVAELNGYFLLTDATPGSARVYYIEPGATDPGGLDFFSTASVPGNNVKVERVGDELWFLKEEGTEVHVATGDADLPFQRIPGRNYDVGTRARDTVCRYDNSLAWVGNDGVVYRGDASPVRFSTHTIEEQVRKSLPEFLRAWAFDTDGHRLYILTTEFGTWAYDVSSQQWSEFGSYGRPFWRAHVGDSADTFVVCGDDEEGLLYRVDQERANDNGEPMVREVTGGAPVAGGMVRCNSFELYATTGTATDPNLYPRARVAWSDDLETYGDYEEVALQPEGRYGEPVRIWSLGAMRYPGRLFKITITDDVVVTISAATINEPSR